MPCTVTDKTGAEQTGQERERNLGHPTLKAPVTRTGREAEVSAGAQERGGGLGQVFGNQE